MEGPKVRATKDQIKEFKDSIRTQKSESPYSSSCTLSLLASILGSRIIHSVQYWNVKVRLDLAKTDNWLTDKENIDAHEIPNIYFEALKWTNEIFQI